MTTIDTHLRAGVSAGEHAGDPTLDHLHTQATVLAGDASKVEDGSSAHGSRRHGGVPAWRLGVLVITTLAVLLGGGAAAIVGSPRVARTAAIERNSVAAYGGAPAVGPAGLPVAAPFVDGAPAGNGGYWLTSTDGGVFAFGRAPYHGSTGGLPLNAPVVGIAGRPGATGYWLAAADGGVFTFGDATFLGSMGGQPLVSPILDIAPTPTGGGYWLVAADGGVFAFGDARFFGSAAPYDAAHPVVSIAARPQGDGYWLLTTDGGVFAFGDAPFRGSRVDAGGASAVSIASTPDGNGYWVLRDDGTVDGFNAPDRGEPAAQGGTGGNPAVDLIPRPAGGYWVAVGEHVVLAPPPPDLSQHPFLVCTRAHESDSAGGYRAVSSSGTYRGAYQFSRSTWDSTARHAGRNDLVGVDPAAAAPADQDFLALHLYQWQGASPWLGRCAGR